MTLPASKRIKMSTSRDRIATRCADPIGIDFPQLSTGEDVNMVGDSHGHGERKSRATSSIPDICTGVENDKSLFLLKIRELLNTVKPSEKRMAKIDGKLRELKILIERTPNRTRLPVSEAVAMHEKCHMTRIPFPHPPPDNSAQYYLEYSKPSSVNVTGSYARKCAIQAGDFSAIDLAITMPSSLFQVKDYLDYRYFHKRAYYLACVASTLHEAEDCSFDVEYAFQNGNQLQPIIIATPKPDPRDGLLSKQFSIRIILAAPENLFPLAKTMPARCCIRTRANDGARSEVASYETPFYNASLRSECSSLAYLKLLHSIAAEADGFKEACVLGGVWLRQRNLSTDLSGGGFGSFEWACMMALLLQGGGTKGRPILSKGYSGYHMFKVTLHFLAQVDLITSPLCVRGQSVQFSRQNAPVLFDGAHGLNILFKMTPWSYAMLKHEANRTLGLLGDPVLDHFNSCFISKAVDPVQKYDSLVQLTRNHQSKPKRDTVDAVDDITLCQAQLYRIIRQGLGDRVSLLSISTPSKGPWSITESSPPANESDEFLLGLLFTANEIYRTVDKGPPAEDKANADAFRRFWGDKAELRRFKDGSILESLIWTTSKSHDDVFGQIFTYVIDRHFGEDAFDVQMTPNRNYDDMLASEDRSSNETLSPFQLMMSSFKTLEDHIRGLDGLPLNIKQISAADPQLRYTSVKPPLSLNPAHFSMCNMSPANVCVQFEGSSRWPDDFAAVQRTKIAFLQKIADLLGESISDINSQVGLESTTHASANTAFLDVRYSSGALFRLRIHHERELSLLERELKSPSHAPFTREVTASAISTYKRNFLQMPHHTQAICTLVTQFPALSVSIRLMKRWRNCHLLTDHIKDELLELLTVRVFVHASPSSVPASAMAGFLRTLTFISQWDWRFEPLIVDYKGEMSSRDLEGIRLRFEAWRKIDPAMNRIVMFAASNADLDGTTWTEKGPSTVVATRFTSLARAAITLVKEQGVRLLPESIFETGLAEYDFAIFMKPKLLAVKQRGLSEFKNLQIVQNKSLAISSPAETFASELRDLHGISAMFFHDADADNVITGLWKPQTGSKRWKINVGYSSYPTKTTAEEIESITMNRIAILNDMARLGGDMIARIKTKS